MKGSAFVGDVGECRFQRRAVPAGKGGGRAVAVQAHLHDGIAVARRQVGEILLARGRHALQRRQRRGDAIDERARARKRVVIELGARLGVVDLRRLAIAQLGELGAKGRERMGEPGRTGTRARSPQDRPLQGGDRVAMSALRLAEPCQRMFQQRQQRHRRQPLERRGGDQPCEHAGRGFRERIAAGVVGIDVPAPQRHRDPARQRPVRRHQRRGARLRGQSLAQRDRDGERLLFHIGGFDDGDGQPSPGRARSPTLAAARLVRHWSVAAAGRSASLSRISRPSAAGGRARSPRAG